MEYPNSDCWLMFKLNNVFLAMNSRASSLRVQVLVEVLAMQTARFLFMLFASSTENYAFMSICWLMA